MVGGNKDAKEIPQQEEMVSNKLIIEGFGNDVPISYALASIVPSNYAYAFGAGINPAMPITWRGGKAWDIVLIDALRMNNMFVHITDTKVSIQKEPMEEVQDTVQSIVNKKSTVEPVYIKRIKEDKKKDKTELLKSVQSQSTKSKLSNRNASGKEVFIRRHVEDIPSREKSLSDDNLLDHDEVATFNAKAGQTVHGVLEEWSNNSGVKLNWETTYDFPVEKSLTLNTTYPLAVQELLAGQSDDNGPVPITQMITDFPSGDAVLTVK
jgi:hypothetical protein